MAVWDSTVWSTSVWSPLVWDFGTTPPPPAPAGPTIIGPAAKITVGNDGGTFQLSDVAPNHQVTGGVAMQFVMSNDWVGSITIQCRSAVIDAWINSVPFLGAWPYHRFYLNGSASDGSLVTTPITGTSNILVPTSGNMVAIAVTCSAGSATLCYQPVSGFTAP